jgi:uncharacterized protein (TIGR03663 family)
VSLVAPAPVAAGRAAPARRRGELIAWGVLIVAALALRLYDLGDRPFHHDESQDAYFSWRFYTEGDYVYQPILHGPLRFYLTSAMFLVGGVSDFTARLAPALMGVVTVALPYGLRSQLGRVGAFAAAGLLAVGPSFLYFSRFAREDIYFACITLALIVVAFRFLEHPRPHQPALLGGLLALSFATKETTFISGFVGFTFLLGVLAVRPRRAALVAAVRAVGGRAWAWAGVTFAVVFTVLFTTFLTHPAGLWDGIHDGLSYWLGQHEVGRGGEAWFFYGVILAGVEWPVLVLAAVGAGALLARRSLLGAFLVWDFAVSFAIYSWAGEKFAWLVLHPLLPLVLLAGAGVDAAWRARHRLAGRVALALAVAGAAYVVFASWSVNAEHRADPRELLVSTQSSEEVKRVAEQVLARAERARAQGQPFSVTVDAAEGATFPWAWYFRDLPTGFVDLTTSATPPQSDALILTQASNDRLAEQLPAFAAREFPFRVWWVRDYGALTPRSALRWLLERRTWSPTGGMPEWVYLRR